MHDNVPRKECYPDKQKDIKVIYEGMTRATQHHILKKSTLELQKSKETAFFPLPKWYCCYWFMHFLDQKDFLQFYEREDVSKLPNIKCSNLGLTFKC